MSGLVHPIILSGGAGTRLWPMSRALRPKQLLPLNSDRSLLQETVGRVTGPGFGPPMIVCNEEHRFLIAEQMREIGAEPSAIVLEPAGRNTAPAATVAAVLVAERDPEGVMLVLPSDHVIEDVRAFHGAVATVRVLALAKARELVVEWQGGIALAHALGDATVLAESFRRAEQRLLQA